MNKLFKYILVGIALFSLCFAQAKAEENYFTYNGYFGNFTSLTNGEDFNINNYIAQYIPSTYYKNTVCVQTSTSSCYFTINIDGTDVSNNSQGVCWNVSESTLILKNRAGRTCPALVFMPSAELIDNLKDPSTSSQCQEMYSLIPISEVDNNYCEINGLCTVCGGGSGEINTGTNRSSLFLNGTQINSNAIIDIYADDRLNTEVEYLNDTVDINITQNVDTSYIEGVKNNEKLTPTNEDVEYMIQGLQVYIPYIFIGLIIVYTLYLIKKFFRG